MISLTVSRFNIKNEIHKRSYFLNINQKEIQHKSLKYMRNQDILHRIESLIDTLKDIQLASDTAINELETFK